MVWCERFYARCNYSPMPWLEPWAPGSWWRHQMEVLSALLSLCAGNSPVPVNSPHKGQWRGALMFSLICAWINGWVNNRETGDLRRHRTHCDVILMYKWAKLITGRPILGPLLLLRHEAVARLSANGSAAFIEICAAIGCKDCDSVRSLL